MKIKQIDVLYDGFERNLLISVEQPNGSTHAFQVNDHGNGASVLAVDRVRRTALMIRQSRVPLLFLGEKPELLELPGGRIEADGPEASAVREVMEETGFAVQNLQPLGRFWPMPGISTEQLFLYLAAYSADAPVGAGGGLAAEGENIAVVHMPLATLGEQLDNGLISDLRTHLALQTLRQREPALFA